MCCFLSVVTGGIFCDGLASWMAQWLDTGISVWDFSQNAWSQDISWLYLRLSFLRSWTNHHLASLFNLVSYPHCSPQKFSCIQKGWWYFIMFFSALCCHHVTFPRSVNISFLFFCLPLLCPCSALRSAPYQKAWAQYLSGYWSWLGPSTCLIP